AGEHVEPTPQRPHLTHPVHLRLRFSEALRPRLEHAAEKNRWPMTAEIIERLEKSFEKQDHRERTDEAASAARRGEGLAVDKKDKATIKGKSANALPAIGLS